MTVDPRTILRVIARLNIGGPAIHTILLTSRLPRERYRSILVKGREAQREGNMLALAEKERVEPIELPELGREIHLLGDVVAFVKLVKLMWREQPSIVHTHTSKAGALGRLATLSVNLGWSIRRLLGLKAPQPIRTVHTFHGHVFQGYFSKAKTRFFIAIERALARVTDALVAISPRQREEIVENLGIGEPEKVKVVPLGLDLDPFRNCPNNRGKLRAELGLGEKTRLIGIVGRLVPIKRHDILLEALTFFRDSPATKGDLCCVVVGDGELRPALEQRVKEMGLDGHVRFLGWRRDLETIYADLDCLVLTSENEGTPVSVIEALSAGVPVVATAVGGVPDLFRPLEEDEELTGPVILSNGERLARWQEAEYPSQVDGPLLATSGVLVPPGDARAVATALELLWTEPNLISECARRGSSWVHQTFTVERLVSDIDALYQELLDARPARRREGTPREGAA
ncbi:glycosyltransferase [Nitrospinae bacterium AH_259_B05_G02_I21]|nr:glycosyltransferase [Nitrospinae bacterium AH_259_B05_G02_I21]MDA2931635.1 glycosyltransferase [Nitrospinae bacterium AH-259-F20]